MTVLQTERLILRPWSIDDASVLYRYASDPRVGPIAGWVPHESIGESRRVIEEVFSASETYAVVLRETGEPVGCAGILDAQSGFAPMGETEREIGYWIGVPYWGQGLATEAARELVRRCFEDLGCTQVWCSYYDGNGRSRRVQEKCGFKHHHMREGVVSPLGDMRTEHYTCLPKTVWTDLT